jgi:signal transduction histidine kinase
MCKKHNYECSLNLQEIDPLLSPETQTKIYRILQESLNNIGKHAGATQVSMTLNTMEGKLVMEVADNGKGFKVEEVLARPGLDRGLGLTAMLERVRQIGGALEIASQTGQGTRIRLTLPLPARVSQK